jgi:hypothetical protein
VEAAERRGPALALLALVVAGWIGIGLAAASIGGRAWQSVIRYRTPFRFGDGDAVEGPQITHRVVLVVIDGLRLDRSRRMGFLNDLRMRGADFDCLAGVPSYSRSARATLVTGAWPEVHGVTTNRRGGTLDFDNLFRASRRISSSCAVAGSRIWQGLFGPDLEGSAVLESHVDEPRGGFPGAERLLRAFERDAVTQVLARPARLSVVDLVIPDYAAHEFGALSPEYGRACFEADRTLGSLVAGLNLWTTTVVVTSDHGHRDRGGHGGDEDVVRGVPLVMVGRGIRARFHGGARQIDVAPTIATLLGLPMLAGSEGRPLVEAIDTKEENVLAAMRRAWVERRAFGRQYAAALGQTGRDAALPDPSSSVEGLTAGLAALDRDLADARDARVEADRRRRAPVAVALLTVPALLFAWLHRGRRVPALLVAGAAAGVYWAFFRLLVGRLGIDLSISAINYEEDVVPYFARLVFLASLSLAAALLPALIALRLVRPALAWRDLALLGLAGVAGAAVVPFVGLTYAFWRQGLFMAWHAGDLRQGFGAIVDLAQLRGLGFAAAAGPFLALLVSRALVKSGDRVRKTIDSDPR